jgi:hypothetical protein
VLPVICGPSYLELRDRGILGVFKQNSVRNFLGPSTTEYRHHILLNRTQIPNIKKTSGNKLVTLKREKEPVLCLVKGAII